MRSVKAHAAHIEHDVGGCIVDEGSSLPFLPQRSFFRGKSVAHRRGQPQHHGDIHIISRRQRVVMTMVFASIEDFFSMVGIEKNSRTGHIAYTFYDGGDDMIGVEYAVVVIVDVFHGFGTEPRLRCDAFSAVELIEAGREA